MSSISSVLVSAVSSASGSSSQQTISSLQQQMTLYSQFAEGSGPAAQDYKALQLAIQTKNVSDAQSAMARLQRDSQTANSPSSATANDNPPAANGAQDASSGASQILSGSPLNLMA